MLKAIEAYKEYVSGEQYIEREIIACLFEMPWEIENTRHHYMEREGKEKALLVDNIADKLRMAISDLVWDSKA